MVLRVGLGRASVRANGRFYRGAACAFLDCVVEARLGKHQHAKIDYAEKEHDKGGCHECEFDRGSTPVIAPCFADRVSFRHYPNRRNAVLTIGVVNKLATVKSRNMGA